MKGVVFLGGLIPRCTLCKELKFGLKLDEREVAIDLFLL